MRITRLILLVVALASVVSASDLALPDPLAFFNGQRVTSPELWRERRRPEIIALYETHVFGRRPTAPTPITFEVISTKPDALNHLATRKIVRIYLLGRKEGPMLDLLLYVPNGVKGPVPAFLGLNFLGNQAVTSEPDVPLTRAWLVAFTGVPGIVANHATEANRGAQVRRWPLEAILKRGYAVATACYAEIEPDDWQSAQASLLHGTKPSDACGAIGAWAFGLSRALDYLEKEPAIDAKRVALTGHSRLGKTSLWAGAQDERFALVISSCSGEGGAALARRKLGERITDSVRRNSFWYCPRYRDYADREENLPVDSHFLISLIAPRPVYVSSATEDTGADPEGEFLGAKNAESVYALFGRKGLGSAKMPPPDTSIGESIGYHVRTGAHDILPADWAHHLDFADRHLKPR
jgi:hypothetical protein